MGCRGLSGVVLCLAGLAAACAPSASRSPSSVVSELRQMAAADQASRTPPNNPDEAADAVRQRRVLELLANGKIQGPEPEYDAALILQHSGLTFADGKVTALSRDNFLLAHLLAKAAVDNGDDSARSLAATALDRYLVFSGKPQKYGTQSVYDPKTQKMVVPPIDPSTTDAERAAWHVQPLAEFLKSVQHQTP